MYAGKVNVMIYCRLKTFSKHLLQEVKQDLVSLLFIAMASMKVQMLTVTKVIYGLMPSCQTLEMNFPVIGKIVVLN